MLLSQSFYSTQTSQRAPTASVDNCMEECPIGGVTSSGSLEEGAGKLGWECGLVGHFDTSCFCFSTCHTL